MDRETFAKLALERLERVLPEGNLRLQEADFSIAYRRADQLEGIVHLANYYAEHEAARPDAREAVLARLERSAQMVDSEESLDEIRVNILPRIKPRRLFTIDMVRQIEQLAAASGAKPKKQSFYHRPLAELLGVGVAIDRPDQVAYIPDPQRYGVDGPELLAIGLENLRRMTKSGLEEVKPGLWRGAWQDDYAAERMLLPHLWDVQVDGAPVVFLAGTDKIYVGGSRDHVGLEQLYKIAEERSKAPRGFGPLAFIREDGAWSPFEPKGALGRQLGTVLAFHLADAYAEQKETLQQQHADLFVGSVMGIAGDGELVMTIVTWGKDVATLLPRTTHVGLVPSLGGEPIMVPWEDLLEVLGAKVKRVPDVYPPRWRAVIFPDADELYALRARSVSLPNAKGGKRPGPQAPTPARSGGLPLAWIAVGVLVAGAIAYAACPH